MSMEEEELSVICARGRLLAKRKQWVFHPPTGALGPAEEFFDGIEKVWTSPVNDQPVAAPVLKLLTGHAFLLRDLGDPIELTDREVELYLDATRMLTDFVQATVTHAAEKRIPPETVLVLLAAVLRAQQNALELVKRGPEAFA